MYGANSVLISMCFTVVIVKINVGFVSIKIEIPGDYLEFFFVANGECMWKYGRILQFLVANATILVAMYSVGWRWILVCERLCDNRSAMILVKSAPGRSPACKGPSEYDG